MPDKKKEPFPAGGQYERAYDQDAASYKIVDKPDAPVGGAQEQVHKEEIEQEERKEA
jgi:hypothetical protein